MEILLVLILTNKKEMRVMKKSYSEAELEIVCFEKNDVIIASPGDHQIQD